MQFSADALLERNAVRWCVGALALVLFAIANLPWQLDDFDQAKQAFTSFEMVEQGHWLYQHTPNGWVATKPPLVGWISAGIYVLARSWEIAWRLPSLLSAVALFLLVGRAARDACGAAAGLIAATALAFNLFAPRLATLVRTDMPLALVVFLIGAQIWRKTRDRTKWSAPDRLISFLLLAVGVLIKGPIIYAFMLPGIAVFQWLRRRAGEPGTAWCGWWPWIASLLLFVVWVAAGIWFVPEFLEHVVIREFGGRFEGTHRAQPLYFYLPHLLLRFAPWTLLLVVFAVLLGRRNHATAGQRLTPATTWLICWAVGGLVVMSMIPSKRVDRVFPIVPPLCLLLAAQLRALQCDARLARIATRCATAALVFAIVFSSGYVASRIVPAYRQHRDSFAVFGRAIRAEAAARSLRFAVIGGDDEGMLLYLRKTQFTEPLNAIDDWNAGRINALVGPEEKLARLLPRLPGAVRSRVAASGPAGAHDTRYALLVRE